MGVERRCLVDLLVVAPHPDDAEISVGGTLLAAKQEGLRTGVVDLTSGEPTPFGSPEIRERETARATEILGLTYRENLGLPNRSLEATLDARRLLAGVFRETRPKVVFIPYWEDAHPDHLAATQLAEAARFWAKLSRSDLPGEPFYPPRLLYYFSIHLKQHVTPPFVIDISSHIEKKMAAIGCYESQFIMGRKPTSPSPLDDIRDRARYWGWSISAPYAEPFTSREQLGLRSISSLL